MEIHVKINRPRWLPERLRWRTRVLVAALALLTVAVPVAWASHDFADVPTEHQFHSQISAIKNAGITTGCGGGNYCPDEFVRRDAMAAFMHRGFGRAARGTGGIITLTSAYQTAASTTITAGAVSGNGFVVVTGDVSFRYDAGDCPCSVLARLRHTATNATQFDTLASVVNGAAFTSFDSTSSTWVFPVAPGSHTFVLEAALNNPSSGPTITAGNGHISAVYVPFGSAGGSAMSAGDAAAAAGDLRQR
jgi:hypothetical protein